MTLINSTHSITFLKSQEIVEFILNEARLQGATACEINIGVDEGLSASILQSKVETIESCCDESCDITVYAGKCRGSTSTSSMSMESIRKAVSAAVLIAKHTSEDKYSGLADTSLMSTCISKDFDLFHPWGISIETALEKAISCESAALQESSFSKSDGTTLSSRHCHRVYANSNGFFGKSSSTQHGISCVMIAKKSNQMQRDYYYDLQCKSEMLKEPSFIGKCAAKRAIERLGACSIPTCEVPVLFTAELACGLFNIFLASISGTNLYREASFMLNSIGKRVFPEWLGLKENPHLMQAIPSISYDSDGLDTYPKSFIEDGVLTSYILDTYSGRKLGLPSTANGGGVRNLIVSCSEKSQEDLISLMGTGFFVTELMGSGINMVTGDYSRGASGFWIQDGKVQFPVGGITIAGNILEMFKNIVAIGNDVDVRNNVRSGSLIIEKMRIGGT